MFRRNSSRQAARRRHARAHQAGIKSLYRRKLRYEPLEHRQLLALVTVDTLEDTVDLTDGHTSLREAIFATNILSGLDTIEFSPALTTNGPTKILLTQGELRITDDLTINGPGAELLTIDASGSDPTPGVSDGKGSRVFNVDDAQPEFSEVTVSGLTLKGGDSSARGGAILTSESLSIVGCTIRDNVSRLGEANGGGIAAILRDGANFSISHSFVFNNRATGRGGGLFLDVGENCAATIDNTRILENESSSGGGIYVVNSLGDVSICNSTLTGNTVQLSGGAIYAAGEIAVERSSIDGNSAGLSGGGVQHTSPGALTLVESEVENNSAHDGGGISLRHASTSPHAIVRSTIAMNTAHGLRRTGPIGARGSGGGIYAEEGSLWIVASLIEHNTARTFGGGLYVTQTSSLTSEFVIEGSTVYHNSAERGGGLDLTRGGTIRQSTISGNLASVGGGIHASGETSIEQSTLSENVSTSQGAGVLVAAGELQLDHSIAANNSGGVASGEITRQEAAIVNARYSLIENGNGSGLAEAPLGSPDANGNLIGGPTHGLIEPLLRPLANYGGTMVTHALAPNSPAVDAGDPNAQAGVGDVPLFDQRGVPYARIVENRIDIGAFEHQGPIESELTVDTLADELDTDFSRGDLSLREAIILTNISPEHGTIRFDPLLTASGPAAIALTLGDLRIVDDVAIIGPGQNMLTIDATGSDATPAANDGKGSRIFNIDDGSDDQAEVVLSGLTLTGGDTDYGGAILNAERLTITNSTISGNYALALGGGVAGVAGNLTINSCTIADNVTAEIGGGLSVADSDLDVVNCTISDNSAHVGGGIHIDGSDALITDSTIADNSTSGPSAAGGGILHQRGTLTVMRSIISGNDTDVGGGIYNGDDATIVHSRITGNSARRDGGGIHSFGRLEVQLSTLSDNSTMRDGGGIRARGDVTIDSSTLARNSAGRSGGGVWLELEDDIATIINATISGNASLAHGGGVWLSGLATPSRIAHSTVYENSTGAAGFGGGIFVPMGSVALDHAIVAKNVAQFGPDLTGLLNADFAAHYSFIGLNSESSLQESPFGQADGQGNRIGGALNGLLDPQLAPLASNGGPNDTHAPLLASPVINAGDPSARSGEGGIPQFDGRGLPYTRVVRAPINFPAERIDIGAFEVQRPGSLTSSVGDYNFNGIVDTADYAVWRNTSGSGIDLRADGNGNGAVDQADYEIWRAHFGRKLTVEPVTVTDAASVSAATRAFATSKDELPHVAADSVWQAHDLFGLPSMRPRPTVTPWRNRAFPVDEVMHQDALLIAYVQHGLYEHMENDLGHPREGSRVPSSDTDSVDRLEAVFETFGRNEKLKLAASDSSER
jgi:hypothetical protein